MQIECIVRSIVWSSRMQHAAAANGGQPADLGNATLQHALHTTLANKFGTETPSISHQSHCYHPSWRANKSNQ